MPSLQSWALIGDAVGGIATAVAVCLAIYEVRRRRTEARHLRQSQAASRALIALTTAHDAYQAWLDPIMDTLDTQDTDSNFAQLRGVLGYHDRDGRKASAPAFQELYQAYAEALVHLAPATATILFHMHGLPTETRNHLDAFYRLALTNTTDSTEKQLLLDAFRDFRGTLQEGLTLSRQLLKDGAAQLLDIARLEA